MSDSTSSGAPGGPKRATRQALLARRDALPAELRAAASATIATRTSELLADRLARGAVVAMYAAKGSEVATAELDAALRARGWRVVYPRVLHDTRQLAFAEVTLDALVPSRYGLGEPAAEVAAIAVADVAAFVMPGLAFDRAGGRIGWGKGHYDATLALAREGALRIGLAYECQIVESVPREPHDVPVHFIITEVATHAVA